MATKLEGLITDILTALRANHTYVNLSTASGTPRVIIDEGQEPPVNPPWVAIGIPDDIRFEPLEIGRTKWSYTGSFMWIGYVAGTADTTYNRALRAAELASDVCAAINAAWGTDTVTYPVLARLTHLQVEVGPFVGDSSHDLLSEGIAYGRIRFTTESEDGGL